MMEIVKTGVYKKLNNHKVPWIEKLQLAHDAWHSAEFWLPNKHQVLLDWLCQILISTNKTKRSFMSEREISKVWSHLLDFLQSKELSESDGMFSLKPQMIQVFTDSLSPNMCEKTDCHGTLLPTVIKCCWLILSHEQLSSSFVARFEAYVNFLAAVLSLFVAENNQHIKKNKGFLQLMKKSLQVFLLLQRKQANQKKVFLISCEKLVRLLLALRFDFKQQERGFSSTDQDGVEKNEITDLWKLVESLMAAVFFHRDHMVEYQLGLKVFKDDLEVTDDTEPASKKPRFANYVKQFFTTIGALTETKCKEPHKTTTLQHDVLSALPFLYQEFLRSSRNGKAVPPVVEFDFFQVLCLMMGIPSATPSDGSGTESCPLDNMEVVLCLSQMLSSVFRFDVYQVVDDNANGAVQYEWFSHLAHLLLQSDICPASFECLETLSRLNHQIVELHLQKIWTLFWEDREPQEEHTELTSGMDKLLSSLLHTYSKLRQIDRFLKEGLKALRSSPHVLVKDLPKQFLNRLVELPQKIPCKHIIELWKLLLDELCNFYVPSLVSSADKESHPSKRERRGFTKTLLCQLHYVSVFLNVLLSNTTFGGIVEHYTTTQIVVKLKEMMEISCTKVLGPLLALCPQFSSKKLIKSGCRSTLILFHTLQELSVFFEKCKILKSPFVDAIQSNVTWSEAVGRLIPHESWESVSEFLTEDGPLKYLMDMITIQHIRIENANRPEPSVHSKLVNSVCQIANADSNCMTSWDGEWHSLTKENYVVAHWHLITCHFSLLFPGCTQEQQRLLTRFLVAAAMNAVDSNDRKRDENRFFTLSSVSLKLLRCVQIYDYEAFQHSLIQAIWQQVAELPVYNKCDSAADVVETLKMLGSDDAKKKGIGESFEHHETTSSEEDSSSLESSSDEEEMTIRSDEGKTNAWKAHGMYRDMWCLIQKVLDQSENTCSDLKIEQSGLQRLLQVVKLMSVLPFEWLMESCHTSCFIGLISTDVLLHQMKMQNDDHVNASCYCRSLMWTILRGCLNMRRYTLHQVVTVEKFLVWILRSSLDYCKFQKSKGVVCQSTSKLMQVSIGLITAAANFILHKPKSSNTIHDNEFWLEVSDQLKSLIESVEAADKNSIIEVMKSGAPLLLCVSKLLGELAEVLSNKTVRRHVPERCAECLRYVAPQVVQLVDILIDRTAGDEVESDAGRCSKALCQILVQVPAIIGSFAQLLCVYCMYQESRTLDSMKELLESTQLQQCIPTMLSSAFHLLQTLSHKIESNPSTSDKEHRNISSYVFSNGQEVRSNCMTTSLQLIRVVCSFRAKLNGIPESFHIITLALLLHLLKELLNKSSDTCNSKCRSKCGEQAAPAVSYSFDEGREKLAVKSNIPEEKENVRLISEVLLALFQGCRTDELSTLLCGLTNELTTRNLERVSIALTVWLDLLSNRWAKRTKELRPHVPQVLFLLHCALQELRSSERTDLICLILNVIVKIVSLGKDVVLSHNATLVLQGSLLVDMEQAGKSFTRLFQCQVELLSTVLFQHSEAIYNTVHVFLSCAAKLLKSLLSYCNEKHTEKLEMRINLKKDTDERITKQEMILCAQKLARLHHEIASHKVTFSKYAPYMIAEYITGLSLTQLPSAVKDALVEGIYCLLDLCGTHEMALLHAVLEKASLELFRALLSDYNKYHKFKGKV